MSTYWHDDLGLVDVYSVGVLHDLLIAGRALTVRGYPRNQRVPTARDHMRRALRTIGRHVSNRDWHGLSNCFNGYLAEPQSFPAHMTRCGHAWSKKRALADLDRHHRATLKETR